MTKYINKTDIMAEIKKRYEYWREKEFNSHSIESEIRMSECQHLMLLLNILEIKDVDIELNSFDATVCKIGNTYLKEMDRDAISKALEPYKDGDKVKVIIKAQKESKL